MLQTIFFFFFIAWTDMNSRCILSGITKYTKIEQVGGSKNVNDFPCCQFIYVVYDHNREHWVYSNIQYRYVLVRKVYIVHTDIIVICP